MPELRKDPVIGKWVILATERSVNGNSGLHLAKSAACPAPYCPLLSACKIISGVAGKSVIQTPMASWMALRIAAIGTVVELSQKPFAPKGPFGCGISTMSQTFSPGISVPF